MARRRLLRERDRPAIQRMLRRVFGHRALRAGQEQVIANVLARRSTLAIMPTGAGKSLCYQLPALHLPGRTIVVSPLIALMKDQVDKLRLSGIAAVAINSAQPASELADAMKAIAADEVPFVFTTPERLADPAFVALVGERPIDLFVVDEAHCISQWGHDFRPAFLEIGAAIRALRKPQVLALTATANERVIADIAAQLGVELDVLAASTYRENLHFAVRQTTSEAERSALAVQLASELQGTGIIYTATVKAAIALHDALAAAGESVALYHGRLAASARHASQEAFMTGAARVMVATNAFGLGIDKPDIRFVLHYQLPANLDAYYQEAGRAGRDGERADCTLLYLHQDRALRSFLQAGRYPSAGDIEAVRGALAAADAADSVSDPITLRTLAARLPIAATKVQVAVKLLKDHAVVHETRDHHLALTADAPGTGLDAVQQWADAYRERAERDRAALERLVSYAQSGGCRWKLLLEHFDEAEAFNHCGVCDNCIEPPVAAVEPEPERAVVPITARALRSPGELVRVARHGVGQVIAATSEAITLAFPDGTTRSFAPDYVSEA